MYQLSYIHTYPHKHDTHAYIHICIHIPHEKISYNSHIHTTYKHLLLTNASIHTQYAYMYAT